MNTETSIITTNQTVAVYKGADIELSAETPAEMVECQKHMVDWCQRKVDALKAEELELTEAYEHAVKHKWKSGVLKRHAALALKRIEFYSKMHTAVQAGYCIVPNFPVTVFAIRTDRSKPLRLVTTNWNQSHTQDARMLPEGTGEYKNPNPPIFQNELTDGKHEYFTGREWKDEIEFPIQMAKPRIMEATSRAMALKVFDDLGILPEEKKKDPIIVARMHDPRSTRYSKRWVTFMIAWHLDTKVL